jgi:transcription-repair coupling factor (superfamily II helicase)
MVRNLLDSLSCAQAVGFVPASLQALVAACILRKTGRPVLWVVENVDAMEQAEDDLVTFLGTERVMPFPPYDVRPYQDDSPSREVMARRIATLHGLLSSVAAVVVVPVQALCAYTLPASDLSEALIPIRTGMEIDRDDLAARLVHMGYTREALVDDVGQFGIRGSVMDIYSPGMTEPVRLDLFGDEVKTLKSFDVRSQRTRKTLTATTLLPAGEVLLDSRHVRTARPLMRMRLQDRLRFVIEDMEHGIRTPGIESFLVLFSERPSTLFDYLPRDAVIMGPDAVEAGMLWDEIHASFTHGYERALSLDRPALCPLDCLMSRQDLLDRMDRFSRRVSTSAASPDGPLARSVSGIGPPPGQSETAFDRIISLADTGMDVFVFTVSDMLADRVEYALQARDTAVERTDSDFLMRHAGFSGRVRLVEGNLSSGFILPGMGVALASAEELLGARRRKRKGPAGPPIYDPFTQLSVGDAVVHRDKGIGLFQGVVRLEVDGTTSDYVLLEYLGGDRLYVPVYNLSLLQRYVGDVDHYTVDRLGGTRWITARAKAQKSVAKLAGELLQLYAKRQAATGFAFDTTSPFIQEFADSFPYVETDDQLKAVEETYADLSAARPMDRLICGDVGYGKTEVALRAAFVAVMSGRQVAVLVPTTLLARQHLMTFRDRMAGWPIRVESLSSMGAGAGNRELLADLAAGTVDIVIGTHGLLSERVAFADLGLLIVDEEHRFGVRHKEKLKSMRAEVDILTLTATPIPRTLNMAISGLRELSIIETPPADRKAIETAITRFDEEAIQAAVTRELQRGGQVFFVHNTVSTIDAMARRIQSLCSQARVGVAHGQMPRARLNRVMSSFLDRSITVLVSSAIISSGIDIPTANTIVINRADTFGLADLYQLRGRVGRSKTKGFCLLLLPETGRITKDAQKRLAAIKEYESLGAGFQMAMRDMEIRGVGDILGKAQWGHVTAIGYELYQEMLREAVDLLQGKQTEPSIDPEIRIRLDAYIPEDYCPDQHLRLGLYKRLFSASADELGTLEEELKDLYGPLPQPVRSLILISEIRDIMKRLRLRKAEMLDEVLRLYPSRDSIIDHGRMNAVLQRAKGRVLAGGALEIPLRGSDPEREIREVFHALA